MYMANASTNARGPNLTYIPPAHIGCIGGRSGCIGGRVGCTGGRVGSTSIFGYQHFGIGNAKGSCLVYCPAQSPVQWNIGLTMID